jgi:hypothetical protein
MGTTLGTPLLINGPVPMDRLRIRARRTISPMSTSPRSLDGVLPRLPNINNSSKEDRHLTDLDLELLISLNLDRPDRQEGSSRVCSRG